VFTPNGVGTVFANSVFSGPFPLPVSLAFDTKGNLFVGNFVETIVQFTPSGMESPFTTVPAEVEGLAFDSAGDLLVANGGGASVLAVAPNGVQRTIATGLPIATGLAAEPVVSSVPEPATALVFAIAVAGLGLTRQRIIGDILSDRRSGRSH
jgi:PEP-CTERM motif